MSREAAAFSVILQPVSAAPGHPHPGEKEPCQNSRSWHPDCRWIGCFFMLSYRWRTDIGILPDTYSSRKQCCSCPANAPPFSESYQSILYCRRSRQCQRERCFCRAAASKVRSAFIGISLVRPEAHIKGVRFHGGRIRDAEIIAASCGRQSCSVSAKIFVLPVLLLYTIA